MNKAEETLIRCSVILRLYALILSFLLIIAGAYGDTFTNRKTGQILHGYKTSETKGSETIIQTDVNGPMNLNLADWQIKQDRKGRANKVVVITLEGGIMYDIETKALENALKEIADQGPLFILLEIDSPGGRIDLAYRICGAITSIDNVEIIAFIKGGETGGALSAAAAVSLATDKIYMSEDTSIGAATMIASGARSVKEAYGSEVGEKYSSAWRARLASLAQQNERSGLLARAMVDKDIEVVEINRGSDRLFVDPVNKQDDDKLIKTWSKKGSLLTLTAKEALACGFADAKAQNRAELLGMENAGGAEVVINKDVQKAATEIKRARGQLARIRKSVDFKIKKSQNIKYRREAFKILREARNEFKTLIRLAKRYPDLRLNVQALEDELNSIEASYQKLKRESRYR